MLVIDLKDSIESITSAVARDTQIKCDLLSLNTFGKSRLRVVINGILEGMGKSEIAEDVYASILELAFNAIKANYAHVITLGLLKQKFPDRMEKILAKGYFDDRVLMKTYLWYIASTEVHDRVKDALRYEAQIFREFEKSTGDAPITAAQKEELYKKLPMLMRTIDEQVKITLRAAHTGGKLVFDIINDAPITRIGLERIRQKREKFRQYFNDDRVSDFYIENLDESESAGFGSAMIDSRLINMGLDPTRHFVIMELNNKTCASITLTF
ncbi:MAG: hypothetical protein AABZ39_17195 [Spirochaetota bacterium]